MPSVLSPNPKTPHQRTQDMRTASPSYFGLAVEPGKPSGHSTNPRGVKTSFSPSSASIRSVAATPPQSLPLHSNPDYDAFRRRSEQSSFTLSQGSVSQFNIPQINRQQSRPIVNRTSSRQAPTSPKLKSVSVAPPKIIEPLNSTDTSLPSRSPKRLLSSESQLLFDDRPRRDSPAGFNEHDTSGSDGSPPTRHDEKHPRLSLPHAELEKPQFLNPYRAETLPAQLDTTTPSLVTPQHVINLLDAHEEEVLVLDLRVSTQYSRAHIAGALNLCVPTTLLKRPSYNVARLADTFKDEDQRARFEKWESCKCIVVYDVNSSQMKEASNCINIINKFFGEGWEGAAYIIRGGFLDFSRKFPAKVEQGVGIGASSSVPQLKLNIEDPTVAPVIGGCPMPVTKNAANPFFGNIRQNMDLIGGVGQMSIKHPASMTKKKQHFHVPAWLSEASDEKDDGKVVSEKFLQIEKREQKRMQEALSGSVVYGTPGPDAAKKVQIAGIEKGSKNRYNNIWPYEHSRVKLENVPANHCDYINANFVETSLSRKKYIATQGPIPATFTDFWNMVWQRDVRVIVMLTAEQEGGQIKAHNYWNDRHYGSLKLQFLSEHRASLELSKIRRHRKRPSLGMRRSTTERIRMTSKPVDGFDFGNTDKTEKTDKTDIKPSASDAPYVTVRKFTLSHDSQPFERMREITQLQYSNWPDFGAPASPTHLLGLVEQCDAVVQANRSNSFKGRLDDAVEGDPVDERPVLVHCSAGCGRTGTFCTVDSVVDMLKQQNKTRHHHPKRRHSETSPMDLDSPKTFSFAPQQPSAPKTPQANGGDFFSQGGGGGPALSLNLSFNAKVAAGWGGVETPAVAVSKDPAAKLGDEWLERDDLDLIERTVEEFRLQRLSMVQSLRQFVLCYETVLEWIVVQQQKEDGDAEEGQGQGQGSG